VVLASSSSSTQAMSGCVQVQRTAWSGQLRVAAISSMLLPQARFRRTSRSSFVSGHRHDAVLSAELSMTLCTIHLQSACVVSQITEIIETRAAK